ncbi:FAD/NAD(P)-binding protein [Solihabitans fulvus]|uniref:FAD/NAD(P)-binding protein n=1 Tax=Solihabitans fulvus TaxID=1892852 RepID=UPI0016621479|nr:FAD/NAD(P)-binding protein [Solihabitans fulvus]
MRPGATGRGPGADLGDYVRAAAERGELVVQPRMGMADPDLMAEGLRAVAAAPARTAGTITLDSYTRVADHDGARAALRDGRDLNGFPIVVHGPEVTARVAATAGPAIPVQVRHGSATPSTLFRVMTEAGLSASEGGPVSYCLPYGRVPLAESVASWRDATAELVESCRDNGSRAHLETFGGCLLGQLCPPSLLVATSVLESLFFAQHGVTSLSLSYAQQTDATQDIEALAAMRRLAGALLPASVDWHLVLYTYMGVYPRTRDGARLLLRDSAELAVRGGAERLIVKTTAEAFRIPTIAENVAALVDADSTARRAAALPTAELVDPTDVLREATGLVEAVLALSDDVGTALLRAFATGLLDVPFCVHPDNLGRTQGAIDDNGRLYWAESGNLPLPGGPRSSGRRLTSAQLLGMLRAVPARYEQAALTRSSAPTLDPALTPATSSSAPILDPASRSSAPILDPASRSSATTMEASVTATTTIPASPPQAATDWSAAPHRIAVLGTGSRGLAVLERLAARLAEDTSGRRVELYAIDAVEIGAGRIWRTDQAPWFLMNTPACEVTMFSGPPDDGPARPSAGPSLAQWWQRVMPDTAEPNGYAERGLYGRYLRFVLDTIEASLPETVTLERVRAMVHALDRTPQGHYQLMLFDGRVIEADRVVLATGHPRTELTPGQRALAAFAEARPRLRYLRGDSPADMPLDEIPSGATVGIIGMGLSFFDVMAALTAGRSGHFAENDTGELEYVASGWEPRIVAGSRGGAPLPARGRNQKAADHSYRPRLFTTQRVRAARAERKLDFRADVLPWITAEVDLVYYETALRQRFGAGAATAFTARAVALAEHSPGLADPAGLTATAELVGPSGTPESGGLAGLAAEFGLADQPPLGLLRRGRPFAGSRFADPGDFEKSLAELVREDLVQAALGNVDGPVKAALDALRDVRQVIRTAVDFGGLTPESHRRDFLDWFVPLAGFVSTGPPLHRMRQFLALLNSGVLRVVGPDASFGMDADRDRFTACSPNVEGSLVRLDVLIDARIPTPDVRRDPAPLIRGLRDSGVLTSFRNTGGDTDFDTGGVAVTDAPFHPIGADGRPDPGLHVLGIPSEHTRWFTQVGSSRPGAWGSFMRDADAIAGSVLAPIAADRPLTSARPGR